MPISFGQEVTGTGAEEKSIWVRSSVAVILGVIFGLVLGCGESTPTGPVATQVTVSPDSVDLHPGQTHQLTAVVLDASGAQLTGAAVTFSSSDALVASTTPGGLVTAVAAGRTTIAARSGSATGSAVVIVADLVPTSVVLTPDSVDFAVGTTATATVVVRDEDDNVMTGVVVTYTSSDTTVFTVASDGVLTARGSGLAWLSAAAGSACDSSRVVVFRDFPGTLQPRAAVPGRPFGVGISSQNVMYVTQQDGDALTRFDLPSLTAIATVNVGDDPGEVIFTADGQLAYTVNVLGGDVSVVNVAGGTVAATYPIGNTPLRIRLSKDEARLFVSMVSGNVLVVDAGTGAVLTTIPTAAGPANGMALSADGSRLYVSTTAGDIAEINTTTTTVLRILSIPGTLQDIALSPDESELYVASETGAMKVVDLSAGVQTDSVIVEQAFGLRVSPDGHFIVVSQPGGVGRITILDRILRRVVQEFDVGGTPRRIVFDLMGTTMAVANEADAVDVFR